MKIYKKFLAAACAACLCVGTALPARAAGAFTDVPEDAWYAQAAAWAAEREIMTGAGAGRFNPEAWVTRSTVVTTLWRLAGSPEAGDGGFADVPEGAWYAQALGWAREAGIAAGDGADRFRPDAAVSRQELAVFLWRYARYQGQEAAEGVLGLYRDAGSVSEWAQEGMRHAIGAGLITGTGAGDLEPWGAATRAELAVILERLETPVMG